MYTCTIIFFFCNYKSGIYAHPYFFRGGVGAKLIRFVHLLQDGSTGGHLPGGDNYIELGYTFGKLLLSSRAIID